MIRRSIQDSDIASVSVVLDVDGFIEFNALTCEIRCEQSVLYPVAQCCRSDRADFLSGYTRKLCCFVCVRESGE